MSTGNGSFVRIADLRPPKMLQSGRMAGLVKLRFSADDYRGWQVWAVVDGGQGCLSHGCCSASEVGLES